ncbi:kinase-like protein [Trametes sanguinea]|nr:kinase-like protein [Trametes sanguinea]
MTSADSADELGEDVFAVLSEEERKWRDRYELLEAHGYRLRPRLRPGWVPSWRGKARHAIADTEDWWVPPFRSKVMDATRVSDETLVYMKSIRTDSEELRILSYLSSDELRRDPRNHCVPLLDVFQDSTTDPDRSIIVMPFMRYIDEPPFGLVDDVLEMLDQVLEGLVFIHDHGVAHRDCAFKNIMMDASALFPKGFHAIAQQMLADGVTPATVLSRASAPVHYYFIDFGISTRFTDDSPRLVVGTDGLDREPPELSKTVPYDPFKLDVFLIGNMIRHTLYEVYSNLPMLEPLMNRMIDPDPSKRPTAVEAHREFKAIRRKVPTFRRYWLLQPRDSFLVVQAFRSVYSLFHSIYRSIF